MTSQVRSKQELQEQMDSLYPQTVPSSQLSRLYNKWKKLSQRPICFPTLPEEVYSLVDSIDWQRLVEYGYGRLFDPCCGTSSLLDTMAQELPHLPLSFTSNDINMDFSASYHMDATLNSSWDRTPTMDVVCSSPPFELLDIILPLCIQHATVATALHVPGDFISNGPQYRRQLWQELEEQGRTVTIEGLPRVNGRPMRRCIWIIIFTSKQWKTALWMHKGDRFTTTSA